MTNEEYIKKWLEGALSEEEEKVFLKSEDYREIKKVLEATQAFKAPEYNVEDELNRLNAAKSGKGKEVHVNWVRPILQIAATFLILAVGYVFFFYNPDTTFKTLAGEKTELYLPDSSFVILNAGSQISYNEGDWNKKRQVDLEGEAFFKVAKGSRFDVVTPDGSVSVLGTEFNVRQRQNYFEAFCYEGLVQVEISEDRVKLPAGNGVKVINKIISQYDNLTIKSPTWTTGESNFQSVPYIQVVQEMERQYGVTIELKNVNSEELFTGGFTHNDLTLALKSISVPLNLSYEVIDTKNIILSAGNE